MNSSYHVVHIITGLDLGGAETALYRIVSQLSTHGFQSSVISLLDTGFYGRLLNAKGVPVYTLGMRRRRPRWTQIRQLAMLLDSLQPDIVQTWMYHADLLGGLVAKHITHCPIVWNVRHSNLEPTVNSWRTRFIVRLCALLSSHIPTRIIYNSHAGEKIHTQLGYAAEKTVIIPNGFDTDLYRPDMQAKLDVRNELGLSSDTRLVGLMARFSPLKDHATFIKAARQLLQQHPDTRFILCGNDVTWENPKLVGLIQEMGTSEAFKLLGSRTDMPRLLAALDVLCSSSIGEGYSNVIGEAMACGIPCVVTDVGDSAQIVGDTGLVVPPRRPELLAAALSDLLSLPQETYARLSEQARKRITDHYALSMVVQTYAELYRSLLHNKTG